MHNLSKVLEGEFLTCYYTAHNGWLRNKNSFFTGFFLFYRIFWSFSCFDDFSQRYFFRLGFFYRVKIFLSPHLSFLGYISLVRIFIRDVTGGPDILQWLKITSISWNFGTHFDFMLICCLFWNFGKVSFSCQIHENTMSNWN